MIKWNMMDMKHITSKRSHTHTHTHIHSFIHTPAALTKLSAMRLRRGWPKSKSPPLLNVLSSSSKERVSKLLLLLLILLIIDLHPFWWVWIDNFTQQNPRFKSNPLYIFRSETQTCREKKKKNAVVVTRGGVIQSKRWRRSLDQNNRKVG